MKHTCQYCNEEIVGAAYHVTSEGDEAPLIDMIVCVLCASVAKGLRLRTRKITRRPIEPAVPFPRYLN